MPLGLPESYCAANGPEINASPSWTSAKAAQRVAHKKGYIVVYPEGTNPVFNDKLHFWNVGPTRKSKKLRNIDDIAFLNAVLDDVTQFFSVDAKRVYATGSRTATT